MTCQTILQTKTKQLTTINRRAPSSWATSVMVLTFSNSLPLALLADDDSWSDSLATISFSSCHYWLTSLLTDLLLRQPLEICYFLAHVLSKLTWLFLKDFVFFFLHKFCFKIHYRQKTLNFSSFTYFFFASFCWQRETRTRTLAFQTLLGPRHCNLLKSSSGHRLKFWPAKKFDQIFLHTRFFLFREFLGLRRARKFFKRRRRRIQFSHFLASEPRRKLANAFIKIFLRAYLGGLGAWRSLLSVQGKDERERRQRRPHRDGK